MALALIVALTAAFLLSNLALRPLTEISRQLDRLTAAEGAPAEGKDASRKDVAALVSTKIEKIGQRMRNVEEVYSALRENLDQILGNLQDGILLFTEDKRAVLVSEAARRFLNVDRDSHSGPARARDLRPLHRAGPHAARGHRSRREHGEGRDSHRKRAAHPGLGGFYLRR